MLIPRAQVTLINGKYHIDQKEWYIPTSSLKNEVYPLPKTLIEKVSNKLARKANIAIRRQLSLQRRKDKTK